MTSHQYRRDRRNLIRECHMLELLGAKCFLRNDRGGVSRVTVAELLVFALFGLEFVKSEAK